MGGDHLLGLRERNNQEKLIILFMKQKYINISHKNRFDSNNPEMKLKQQNSNQTDKKHYGILIHQIARELESSHNTPIRFSDIANCDKRRQSDLFAERSDRP